MKGKILLIILILCVALSSVGCAAGGVGDGGYDVPGVSGGMFGEDVYGAYLSPGENNLREILPREWRHAIVARDGVFVEDGYFRFEDVVAYNVRANGYSVGGEDERALFYGRSEKGIYGYFRAESVGEYWSYYAFYATFDDALVRIRYAGSFEADEVFVGMGGTDTCRYVLIGNMLYAYDFTAFRQLCVTEVEGENYDFTYFQQGDTSVLFDGGITRLYTYSRLHTQFTEQTFNSDLCDAVNPTVYEGTHYLLVDDELTVIALDGSTPDQATLQQIKDYYYNEYSNALAIPSFTVGDYIYTLDAIIDNNAEKVTPVIRVEGASAEAKPTADCVTVEDVITALPVIDDCIDNRVSMGEVKEDVYPYISGLIPGEDCVYIVIEHEPDGFIGLRDVNDGIPPIVVRYSAVSGQLEFCGMVDFTGFEVYAVVPLNY